MAAAAEVVVHVTQDTYDAGAARSLGDDDTAYPDGGFCETADGTVISPIAAVYLSLIGQVRRAVFSTDGELLSYGRGKRLFSPAQAAAIRAKFRRCAHPYGCDRTGPLLQTDHVAEWHNGGTTDSPTANPSAAPTTAGRPTTRTAPHPTGPTGPAPSPTPHPDLIADVSAVRSRASRCAPRRPLRSAP